MKIAAAVGLSKQLSPKWAAVIAYLKKLPADEVMPTWELTKALGYKPNVLTDTHAPEELADYSERVSNGAGQNIRMWGNPRAIKELRRQLKTL